jgi:outer membrane protein assembly factor BamE (lipoprotein component of BamABCDE complex)
MNKSVIKAVTFVEGFFPFHLDILKVVFMLLFLSSCFVQSPKYSTLEQVMSLRVSMTKAQVEEILGLQPYNLKAYTDTSNVFIYVYRVTARRTISFNTKPGNGKELLGKYMQLAVAYSKEGKVLSIESCNLCPDNLVTTSKVDFGEVFVFLTVTLPLLLLYFK